MKWSWDSNRELVPCQHCNYATPGRINDTTPVCKICWEGSTYMEKGNSDTCPKCGASMADGECIDWPYHQR